MLLLKNITVKKKLERNLKIFYLFLLSQNRIFYVLISVYFLTMPGMADKIYMLGWFLAISTIISFFLEIPSGYFSDKFGYKKTLIFSKILLIFSTILYVLADHWIYFLAAAIFQAIAQAFQSGAYDALHHNTMIALNRENEFTRSASKISSNIAFISSIFLVLMPFLAEYNILYPFYIALFLDIFSLSTLFLLWEPKNIFSKEKSNKKSKVSFKKILLETKKKGFLSFSLLISFTSGIGMSIALYQEAYFVFLGAPVAFIGFAAGLSRVIWFIVGHTAHNIEEKLSIKKILVLRSVFFITTLILIAVIQNFYFVMFVIAINTGITQGTKKIYTSFFLRNYVFDQRYKATILSIQSQINLVFKSILPLVTGYLIGISYKEGFLYLAIISLVVILVIWKRLWNRL